MEKIEHICGLNVISVQVDGGIGTQCTTYSEVLSIYRRNFRLTIHTDNAPSQCKVVAEAFDGVKWHEVYRILPSMMMTPKNLGYRPRAPEVQDYCEDRKHLLRVLLELIH